MQRLRSTLAAFACLTLLALLAAPASAQKRAKPERKSDEKAAAVVESRSVVRSTLVLSLRPPKKLPSFSPEREMAALHFVENNHKELASLLIHLRESSPKEYQQAIRELFWTTEALSVINDRDPNRYKLEVEAWKNQSRLQLLAARLSMFPNEKVEKELRAAVEEQIDIRIRLLKHERDRQKSQLKRAEENLKSANGKRESEADRRFKILMRNIEKSRATSQTVGTDQKTDGKTSN